MSSQSQPTQDKPSPYSELHRVVSHAHGRRKWLFAAAITTAVIGLLVGFLQAIVNRLAFLDFIAWVFMYGVIGFAAWPMLVIIRDNMSPSDKENRLVTAALVYLEEKQHSATTLESIERRAAVAHGAGSVRTVLPIVILSLTAPFVFTDKAFPATLVLVLAMVMLAAVLAITMEIDRANTDAIIVQACVEYSRST